jgi:hypothetical protein
MLYKTFSMLPERLLVFAGPFHSVLLVQADARSGVSAFKSVTAVLSWFCADIVTKRYSVSLSLAKPYPKGVISIGGFVERAEYVVSSIVAMAGCTFCA